MSVSLPALHDLKPDDAPHLAQLHLSSASNMMKTLRLVAPSIFVNASAAVPDHTLLLQLEGSQLQLVTCLIDVQLFHLQRAAALVAHARQHMCSTQARL
jgi:hypothetical protein